MAEPSVDLVEDVRNRRDTTGRVPGRPHFPALEGLRALAALLVVFTHAGELAGDRRAGWEATPARMGDIGVAVFFVLSGFLIYLPFATAHLAGERPLRARAFYWRRLLRILPAYWLALSVLWALWHFHPFGFRMGFDLGDQWWRYYTLVHIYDAHTFLHGIIQAWSVATEVSFYLLIPFWSGLLRRVLGKRRTTVAIELIGVAALFGFGYLSRWWFSHNQHMWVQKNPLQPQGVSMRAVAFSWLPNQIDLFALGMGLAIVYAWTTRTGSRWRLDRTVGRLPVLWWAAAAGVFVVVAYVLGPPPIFTGYRGPYWQGHQALYGLFGLLLLVPLVFGDQARGGVRAVLRWKPIWWVGVVSYGFYLWHFDWMSRAVTPIEPPGTRPPWHGWWGLRFADANMTVLMVVGIGTGLAAAAISWYLVERPLLRLKRLVGDTADTHGPNRPESVGATVNL